MKKKALALAASAAAVFTGELYRYVFCRTGSPVFNRLSEKKNHIRDYILYRDSAAERLRAAPQERITIRSDRGEELRGFFLPCGEKPAGKIAFLIHGYRSDHAEAAGMFLDYYHSRGFDLFCCDHTASGESGGHIIGYDCFESADCLKWLDCLIGRFGSRVQIVLHGFSMGGATVLKMSDRVPENVRFIVSDSGYINVGGLLSARLGLMAIPLRLINRVVAGYDIGDTDVRPNLSRTHTPILFVHGAEDRTVPFAACQELYALCPTEKDFLFVPGARHVESMYVSPDAYMAKLDSFIEKYVKK